MAKATKKTTKKSKKMGIHDGFLLWITAKDGDSEDKVLKATMDAAHRGALDDIIDFKHKGMNLLRQKAAAFILSLPEKEASTNGVTMVQDALKDNLYRVLCK